MKLILENPTKLRLEDLSPQDLTNLQTLLKYKDNVVETAIRRHKSSPYFKMRFGDVAWQIELDRLNAELFKSILFEDDNGFYTLPGMKKRIEASFSDISFENQVEYPEFKLRPWQNIPTFDPYPYQSEGVIRMMENPHSHIEHCTGSGKTMTASLLVKETGLPTIISTITQNLAKTFYQQMIHCFGKRNVGMLGAGKKEIGKPILVCVAKSLAMVKKEDFHLFSDYKCLIADESHSLPSQTFDKFVHGVLGHVPYRWFLSATQERNDGKDLLLEGIIGPMVSELTIKDAINKGYLAKLETLIFDVESDSPYSNTNNSVKMNQKHFYGNSKILDIIASLTTQAIDGGMSVLILVDEHEQERLLRNKLGNIFEYARSGADINRICKDFNEGKIMCVVGSSASSTGTDFKRNQLTINWQGGKAQTKGKQGPIGRSTRIDPSSGKTSCKIVDFRVTNVPMLYRHGSTRIKLYRDVGPVQIVNI